MPWLLLRKSQCDAAAPWKLSVLRVDTHKCAFLCNYKSAFLRCLHFFWVATNL